MCNTSSLEFVLIVIGPLCYRFLKLHPLLDTSKRKGASNQLEQRCGCSKRTGECVLHHTSMKILDTNLMTGLKGDTVANRQRIFGPNKTDEHRTWLGWILLAVKFGFNSAQTLIVAGAFLATFLHNWYQIGPIVMLWAFQLYIPAQRQLESDQLLIELAISDSEPAIMLTDKELQKVPVTEIVPGGVVHVSEGVQIPADCKIVAFDGLLTVDEHKITGSRHVV